VCGALRSNGGVRCGGALRSNGGVRCGGALRSNGGAVRCAVMVHYAVMAVPNVLHVCNLLVRFSFTLKKYALHIWSNFLRGVVA
jgi:hypothetical protein